MVNHSPPLPRLSKKKNNSNLQTNVSNQEIVPHGGELINRLSSFQHTSKTRFETLFKVPVTSTSLLDLELIATGVYSPLVGFMGSIDYGCVVSSRRLADGTLWPLPITLPVAHHLVARIEVEDEIILTFDGSTIAAMQVSEIFQRDKVWEAENVFGTTDIHHPGVARLFQQPDTLLAGEIQLLQKPDYGAIVQNRRTPQELRALFAKKGWRTIVGFQTRNPIHAGHEYVFKHALEHVDGLLLHPLVGNTKGDDINLNVRVETYHAVLENYPSERVMLDYFPSSMRYAGPREAVFHAICRQNYGCTHFIIGRDHAGVGDYYAPDAAAKIFEEFSENELKIKILTYETTYYCAKCLSVVTSKTCAHTSLRYPTSGGSIRKMIFQGKKPPAELMRPEVSKILLEAAGYDWSDSGLTAEQLVQLLKNTNSAVDEADISKSDLLSNPWEGKMTRKVAASAF